MNISLENEPLLFVQGPPVYRHVRNVSHWQEESTSIFPEPVAKVVEIDPLMWKRLRFLTSEFAKHVYKPLCFELQNDEKICGVVDELQPEHVQITSPEGEFTSVDIKEIKEIWWGEKVLPTRI